MSTRRAITWILLFCILAFAGAGGIELIRDESRSAVEVEPGERLAATIGRVVDGDTVEAKFQGGAVETVRYIGVDTPESVKPGEAPQCFGKAASSFNRKLVSGRRATLRVGQEPRDRYGRLLAYVYLQPKGRFVNALLIRRGFARTLAIAPNTAFAGRFARLQRRAQLASLGLWRAC